MNKKIILSILSITTALSLSSCSNTSNSTKKEAVISTTEKHENIIPEDSIKYSSAFGQDDLIYFILTDRFNDGDPNNNFQVDKSNPLKFHGGDFKGIIEKLDYIKSTGATAIWITPIVQNEADGYHGYWAMDFYNIEPHLGDMAEFKELVDKCHEKGLKVLVDQVVNHTGYKNAWLKDPQKKDWFNPKTTISNWNDQSQVEKGWLAGLPDLDQENPEVREYLLDNALWLINETGIDGMRLDTVKHVSKDFWAYYTSSIKKEYPDFYFLGEVWNDNPRLLESYHQVGIDGITDYSLYKGIREAFAPYGKTNSLISAIKSGKYFSQIDLNGIFIDNHDNTRLITQGKENGSELLKQALGFIMTYPSIPVIYYGTEVGLQGGSDPDNRRDMPWSLDQRQKDIFSFYSTLVELRKTSSALHSTSLELLSYDSKYFSYKRSSEDEELILIFNLMNKSKEVEIDTHSKESSIYRDLITSSNYTCENGMINITLEPFDVKILKR